MRGRRQRPLVYSLVSLISLTTTTQIDAFVTVNTDSKPFTRFFSSVLHNDRPIGNAPRVNFGRLLPPPMTPLFQKRFASYSTTRLRMARGGPFGDTKNREDPYATLGIPFGTSDKKEIKRGYRRQAMKYHPDVCKDEDRKVANERFIKINAAYELLSGKTGAQNGTTGPSSTSSSSSSSSSNSGGGYTPPHRRTSSSRPRPSSRTGEPSTDWRDYMPNNYQNDYEDKDDKYDAGGDSFASIFSDLVGGMAGAAAAGGIGGGGVMSDLIDFLEGNFPEMTTDNYGKATDPILDSLLQSNDIDAIRNELDDTTLLVQQLETKMESVMDETDRLERKQMDEISFAEKMEREEQLASLNARKKVVEDYLKKSRSRLLKLQTKMKDLRTSRTSTDINDDMKQDWDQRQQQRSSTSSSSGTSDGSRSRRRSGADGGGASSSTGSSYNDVNSGARSTTTSNDASSNTVGQSSSSGKQRESFGSSGRRGSSRRSRSRPSSSQSTGSQSSTRNTSTTGSGASTSRAYNSGSNSSSSARQQPRPTPPPPPPKTSDSTNPQSSRLTSTSASSSSYVPPHRRTTSTSSTWKQQRDDKKRIQELEVEDEFEKLKRELGL